MRSRELIRVLVIDDSAFSRQAITRMLGASPLVEVVGVVGYRGGHGRARGLVDQPDLGRRLDELRRRLQPRAFMSKFIHLKRA